MRHSKKLLALLLAAALALGMLAGCGEEPAAESAAPPSEEPAAVESEAPPSEEPAASPERSWVSLTSNPSRALFSTSDMRPCSGPKVIRAMRAIISPLFF